MPNVVPGYGPKTAELAIIGEAPGYHEDVQGRPFVGASGKLLRESLERVGVDPDQTYITNVIKVRPAGNRTPTTSEIKAARQDLADELAALPNLRVVLLVGAVPFQAVTGTKGGITKNRGLTKTLAAEFRDTLKAECFATLHPALILRNSNYKNGWLADLAALAQLVAPPVVKETIAEIHTPVGLELVRKALRGKTRVALDVETTIGNIFVEGIQLLSVALAYSDVSAAVLVTNEHPEAPDALTTEQIIAFLNSLPTDIEWVMHNGMFDQTVLRFYGGNLKLAHDTMAMQYLLDVDERKGLEFLSSVYLKEPPYKGVDYKHILEEPLAKIVQMNGRDALRTLKLMKPLGDKLNENPALLRLYRWLLMPAVSALVEVTERGVPVDSTKLDELEAALATRQEELAVAFATRYGEKFNPRSHLQVRAMLYETLALPVLRRTELGEPSTDKESLIYLQELALGDAREFVNLLADSRQVESHRRFIPQWRENLAPDGRIHPRYKPLHVVTGRLSSESPNIQQVPRKKEYRNVFGGHPELLWCKADYSQIELRLAAWIAGERAMLQAYATGQDLHTLTAKRVLGDDSPEARQAAKALNFLLLYGGGWSTLQRTARRDYKVSFTEWEAKRYRKGWFNQYPALADWHTEMGHRLNKERRSVSPLGRIRYLPDIVHPEESKRWAALREGINHPVQSFASDLLLNSLVRLREFPKAQPIVEVHDEVDFLLHPDDKGALPEIKAMMESTEWLRRYGIKLTVPIEVELQVGTHWGDLTKEE